MGQRVNFELRIAKLGTRPKGGSPKDNCEFEKAWSMGQERNDAVTRRHGDAARDNKSNVQGSKRL